MPLSPAERAELEQLRQVDAQKSQAPRAGALSPEERAELQQLRAVDSEAAEPGFGERAKQAVYKAVPGYNTAQTVRGLGKGTDAYDVAAAAGGDVAQGALLAGAGVTGGVRKLLAAAGLGAGLNLASDYMQGVNRTAGQMGGAAGEAVAQHALNPLIKPLFTGSQETPSVALNFTRQVPRAVGETLGEMLPTAALMALGGKIPGALRGRAAATAAAGAEGSAARAAAQDLGAHGYPTTESHAVPGDVRLKQALTNPSLSAEREAYMEKLGQAQRADAERTLAPSRLQEGPEATAVLGRRFQEAATGALNERSSAFKRMMDLVDQAEPGRPEVTGIGERTHAGKLFQQRMEADLASRGINVKAIRKKALLGKLTEYDLKGADPGLSAADVQATIRFGDLASQRAPRPGDLAPLASNFARSERLFESGANPGALKERANRTAVDVAREVIGRADEASGSKYPSRLPEWEKQRANWAQGAKLAGEKSRYQPRIDAEGQPIRAEMTSPEQVFRRDVISRGAQGVREWKNYLGANGQDPAIVERMALDHLDELAGGAGGKITAASLKSAWQKLTAGKNAELGAELFDPKTRAKVDELIKRMDLAERPLTVMGTQARGGSQTQPLGALARMKREVGGMALGTGLGTLTGGPLGAGVGAVAGHALQKGSEALQGARQAAFLERPAAAVGAEASALRRAAAQRRVAELIDSIRRVPGGGHALGLPAQAALSASR